MGTKRDSASQHQALNVERDSESDYSQDEEGVLNLNYATVDDDENERPAETWGQTKEDYFKQNEVSDDEYSDSDDESKIFDKKLNKRDRENSRMLKLEQAQKSHLTKEDFELDEVSDIDSDSDSSMNSSVSQSRKSEDKSKSYKPNEEEKAEFLNYQTEIEEKLKVLEIQVKPLLQSLRSMKNMNNDFKFENGISYLEAKSQLLMSYCLNLAFYLMLKTKGENVKEHAVFKCLTKQKLLLEKIRPLDQKLKPQLNRLLKASTNNHGEKPVNAPLVNQLAFDDSDGEDGEAIESQDNKTKKALYQPTKVLPLHYSDETNKLSKDKNKITRKLNQNMLLKEISTSITQAPLELDNFGNDVEVRDKNLLRDLANEKEKLRFEEENLTRLRQSKEDKRKKREREKKGYLNGIDEDNLSTGFDELNFLIKKKKSIESEERNSKSVQEQKLKEFMKKFESKREKDMKRNEISSIKIHDPMKNKAHSNPQKTIDAESSPGHKRVRKDKTIRATTDFVKEGELRKPNYKITKNKGLQPHRKKSDRNPRKRMRTKYEKRVKQRKGQVKDMRKKEEGANYEGEKSGLRTKIVTSRQIGKI